MRGSLTHIQVEMNWKTNMGRRIHFWFCLRTWVKPIFFCSVGLITGLVLCQTNIAQGDILLSLALGDLLIWILTDTVENPGLQLSRVGEEEETLWRPVCCSRPAVDKTASSLTTITPLLSQQSSHSRSARSKTPDWCRLLLTCYLRMTSALNTRVIGEDLSSWRQHWKLPNSFTARPGSFHCSTWQVASLILFAVWQALHRRWVLKSLVLIQLLGLRRTASLLDPLQTSFTVFVFVFRFLYVFVFVFWFVFVCWPTRASSSLQAGCASYTGKLHHITAAPQWTSHHHSEPLISPQWTSHHHSEPLTSQRNQIFLFPPTNFLWCELHSIAFDQSTMYISH